MGYKIMQINEWKESDNYIIAEWMNEKERFIKDLIENNASYSEYEYDRFDHDSTSTAGVRFGYVFFSDQTYNYKLEIIIDYDKLINDMKIEIDAQPSDDEGEDINIDTESNGESIVITEAEYKLNMYDKNNPSKYNKHVISSITDDDITDDFLITLISEVVVENTDND